MVEWGGHHGGWGGFGPPSYIVKKCPEFGYSEGKERLIFITNSQCDISHLSRAEFADIIVDAWVGWSTQWVGISEANGKGGIYSIYTHFHMAKKLSARSSWRAIGKLEKSKFGLQLNSVRQSQKLLFSVFVRGKE